MYAFKEDESILYNDGKIMKINYNGLLLNVKFQRKVVAATDKKPEYEEEIDNLVETN